MSFPHPTTEEIDAHIEIVAQALKSCANKNVKEGQGMEFLDGIQQCFSFIPVTMTMLANLNHYTIQLQHDHAEMKGAMRGFIERVEKGEVRSKKTYALFKDILSHLIA